MWLLFASIRQQDERISAGNHTDSLPVNLGKLRAEQATGESGQFHAGKGLSNGNRWAPRVQPGEERPWRLSFEENAADHRIADDELRAN